MSKYTYSLCAVMFGSDETLLKIELNDGFSFVKKSLLPQKHGLNKVFETDAMGLRRDYDTAKVNDDLDVICVVKEFQIDLNASDAHLFFTKTSDECLVSLDNQIRIIRLFYECPLRFKIVSFRMRCTGTSHEFVNIFKMNESFITSPISCFHCTDDLAVQINHFLDTFTLPLFDEVLNVAHMHYDLSYHQPQFISITLLITALEALFLNDEQSKKEKLSKRCSVYICNEEKETLDCYNKLKLEYNKRSLFVHKGVSKGISDDDILFLRDCVRKSILKMFDDNRDKKERIKALQRDVFSLNYWN